MLALDYSISSGVLNSKSLGLISVRSVLPDVGSSISCAIYHLQFEYISMRQGGDAWWCH